MSQDPLNTPKKTEIDILAKAKARAFNSSRKRPEGEQMTPTLRWYKEQHEFMAVFLRILNTLNVDTICDLEQEVNEYLTLTQTDTHAEAKQKIRALMDNASGNSTSLH